MDAEPRPREPHPGARGLRDISHLYISRRQPAAQAAAAWRPAASRAVRIAVTSPPGGAARAEFCANLAVQFARLGRRTVVLDLDPSLPNVGFRLGLEPDAYLAHLDAAPEPRIARAIHGVRVVVGLPGLAGPLSLSEELKSEVRGSECTLLNLPPNEAGVICARYLAPLLGPAAPDTTVARAAAHSPMFGAWLATVQRSADPDATPRDSRAIDAVLWVVEPPVATADPCPELQALAGTPVRRVLWGDSGPTSDGGPAWARVPAHALHARQPISSLCPEHPAARTYEGLAQSLLAGLARPGGLHA